MIALLDEKYIYVDLYEVLFYASLH